MRLRTRTSRTRRGHTRTGRWASLLLAAAAGVVLWNNVDQAVASRQLRVGNKMPNFSLTDINGKKLNLSSFKNRAVWVAFFHST